MRKDRIELTYEAIDEMINSHGKPKPEQFGGGVWDCKEEFKIYKEQVGNRYSKLQWGVITSYFEEKSKKLFQEVSK